MLSNTVSERVRKRFKDGEIPQLPTKIKGKIMKRVKVEFSSDGIVIEHAAFQVLQGERVLIEDSLSGKISDVFVRNYDVSADDSPVSVRFTNGDVPGIDVAAALY